MNAICLLILCVQGNVYQEFLEAGNTAYKEHRLEDAIAAYGQLADSGVAQAPLYYNLACAYFHQGDVGRAVLNYERALYVDPGFSPAKRGLQAVASSLQRPMEVPDGFRPAAWQARWWGLPTVVALVLALWWLFWGILLAALWKGSPRLWRLAAATLLAVMIVAVITSQILPEPNAAVVVAGEAPVRYGPDDRDEVRGMLMAGDRVRIERVDGAWVLARTATGLRGWMARGGIEAVTSF